MRGDSIAGMFLQHTNYSKYKIERGGDVNKNELLWKETQARSENIKTYASLIKHALTLAAGAWCFHMLTEMLTALAAAQPDSLRALGEFAEKLNAGTILSYVLSAILGGGWYYERRGKKRAIRKTKEARDQLEGNDPFHESSGLDDDGHTPQ